MSHFLLPPGGQGTGTHSCARPPEALEGQVNLFAIASFFLADLTAHNSSGA